jgi:hypothetical protein
VIDYERRMRNWALWRSGGADLMWLSLSNIYDMGPRAPRLGNVMPILQGEAEDVDEAVRSLAEELQRAVVLWYVRQLEPERMRKALRCRRESVQERLDQAREQIVAFLEQRGRVNERRHAALAGGVLAAE